MGSETPLGGRVARKDEVPYLGPDPKLDPMTLEGRINGPAAMFKVTGWRARAMFGFS